jgi:hypothetical protein
MTFFQPLKKSRARVSVKPGRKRKGCKESQRGGRKLPEDGHGLLGKKGKAFNGRPALICAGQKGGILYLLTFICQWYLCDVFQDNIRLFFVFS